VETLYKAYKDKAQIFLVYIREAHPAPEKAQADRPAGKQQPQRAANVAIAQPKTIDERAIAADKCMKGLNMTIPILLDPIEGDYLKAYGGWPAGTVVIDIDGKVVHWTRGAPSGARPKDAEAALKKLIAAGGAAIEEKWKPVKISPATQPATQPAKETTRQ